MNKTKTKKTQSRRRSAATITVRRNRDGTVRMTSRGTSAPDLRRVAPALLRMVAPEAARVDRYADDDEGED